MLASRSEQTVGLVGPRGRDAGEGVDVEALNSHLDRVRRLVDIHRLLCEHVGGSVPELRSERSVESIRRICGDERRPAGERGGNCRRRGQEERDTARLVLL